MVGRASIGRPFKVQVTYLGPSAQAKYRHAGCRLVLTLEYPNPGLFPSSEAAWRKHIRSNIRGFQCRGILPSPFNHTEQHVDVSSVAAYGLSPESARVSLLVTAVVGCLRDIRVPKKYNKEGSIGIIRHHEYHSRTRMYYI